MLCVGFCRYEKGIGVSVKKIRASAAVQVHVHKAGSYIKSAAVDDLVCGIVISRSAYISNLSVFKSNLAILYDTNGSDDIADNFCSLHNHVPFMEV